MNCTYEVIFDIGEVKDGLFDHDPELNGSLLPCLIESCFGESCVTTVLSGPQLICCKVQTDKNLQETADTIVKKMEQVCPQIAMTHESGDEERISYKLGEKSSVHVSLKSEGEQPQEEENDEVDYSVFKNKEELDDIIKNINNLIGWDSFKQFVNEAVPVVADMHKRDSLDSFKAQNYLFSVNDGCGLTRVINLLTLFEVELGVFTKKFYFEFVLSDETQGRKINVKDLLNILYDKENYDKLVCLDISEFMVKSKQRELKDLLLEISHVSGNFNFVFRVPYIEPHELKKIEETLSDILFIKTFTIPPFSDKEIRQYAERMLDPLRLEMEEDAWEVFFARIREEKSDGRFYGLRTVKKVFDETVLLKHQADARNRGASDDTIRCEEIKPLSVTYGVQGKDAFDELSEMIGMEKITERIREIVAQVEVSAKNDKLDRPCMHMRFVGAPGTGKTTVARIIGRIFAERKLLSNGYFFEYGARDFCGEYIGQTAPKTAAICRDAYGSVLFIDEAYDLYRGGMGSENDYGREALTTLISEMENHRDNLVVIMAGYKAEMEKLMQGNAGLRSRMPFLVEFPSYTKEQLAQIFMLMAEKHFACQKELKPAVEQYFDELPQSYISSEEFSNARFVRNLYERTWSKAAMRAQLNGQKEVVLCQEDFFAAKSEKEFSEKLTTGRNRVGF